MFKIFYVGDFGASYSTEVYIAHAFRELGVDIKCWEEKLEIPTEHLAERIENFNPDFVLLSKNKKHGLKLIQLLQGKYKTVSWLFDLYHDLPKEMGATRNLRDSPFKADMVFMTDGGQTEYHTLRQGIHAPEALMLPKTENIDVVFIGSNTYAKRKELIEFLKANYNFRHYGSGGDYPEVRGLELNQVLANAKIVVGDSVPSGFYWSNRMYEVIGRGGFLIHPKVQGLEEEFAYYKHFVPFDYGNYEQLKEKIDYYLTHDKEREVIRTEGFNFCKQNYTYFLRCQTLLHKVIGTTELAPLTV